MRLFPVLLLSAVAWAEEPPMTLLMPIHGPIKTDAENVEIAEAVAEPVPPAPSTVGLVKSRDEKYRPKDWISHAIEIPSKNPKPCAIEVVELKYESKKPKCGAILLIPGLVQNAHLFDLRPDPDHPGKQISYARHLMKTQGLQVYTLNMRGLGKSCYPKGPTNLDDLSMVDVPRAIEYVAKRERRKIHVMGHSQGGIVLQGALAGLTNDCNPVRASCFDAQVARDRQAQVASAGIFGANVAMSSDNPSFRLKLMAGTDTFFGSLGAKVMDRVPVGALARTNALLMTPVKVLARPLIGDASPNNALFWSFLWRRENVDRKARGLFAQHVVEEVPVEVLRQYAEGVRKSGGIRTSSGETYVSALKNISEIPVVMGTFRGDPLSPPEETKRDNFDLIGVPPSKKHFVSYAGLGHEDIFLNPLLHTSADSSMREMVDRGGGCAPVPLKE